MCLCVPWYKSINYNVINSRLRVHFLLPGYNYDTHTLPFLRNLSCKRGEYTYVNHFLMNELEPNTNTYTSKNPREFEMYLFPLGWQSVVSSGNLELLQVESQGAHASFESQVQQASSNALSSTPTPVFLTSQEETQTMVQAKLRPKLRPP